MWPHLLFIFFFFFFFFSPPIHHTHLHLVVITMANFIGGFLTGMSSLYLATHPEAVRSFVTPAPVGAKARCKYCGRDPTLECHDHGYNGFFNDKNMACKGKNDSL